MHLIPWPDSQVLFEVHYCTKPSMWIYEASVEETVLNQVPDPFGTTNHVIKTRHCLLQFLIKEHAAIPGKFWEIWFAKGEVTRLQNQSLVLLIPRWIFKQEYQKQSRQRKKSPIKKIDANCSNHWRPETHLVGSTERSICPWADCMDVPDTNNGTREPARTCTRFAFPMQRLLVNLGGLGSTCYISHMPHYFSTFDSAHFLLLPLGDNWALETL